jgi:exonuclease VII large subunit
MFENSLIELKTRFFDLVESQIEDADEDLSNAKRIVKLSSPQAIINRGFAIIKSDSRIVVDPRLIRENSELDILLKNEIIHSKVIKKKKNEN